MWTAPQVLATPNEPQDLFLDQRPSVHDLRVAHADDDEPSHDQRPISRAIGLEVMPFLPVQLEHQPVTDQQVDPTHSGNSVLRDKVDAKTSQSQTCKSL